MKEEDRNKYSVVRIKNFPVNISDDDVVSFLCEEVDKKINNDSIKTEKTGHSTNVYLDPEPNLEVIAKAIEFLDYNTTNKVFFENRKLHAQLYRPMTPEKPAHHVDNKRPVDDPAKQDSKVMNAVNNFNQGAKHPEPKPNNPAKKNLNTHASLSSAGTPTVARHKEDMRGSQKKK